MSSQTTKTALRGLDKGEFLAMSTRTQNSRVSVELTQTFRDTPAGGSGEGTAVPWDVLQESHAVLLERASQEVRRTGQAFGNGSLSQPWLSHHDSTGSIEETLEVKGECVCFEKIIGVPSTTLKAFGTPRCKEPCGAGRLWRDRIVGFHRNT